jgi:hypothetical protein
MTVLEKTSKILFSATVSLLLSLFVIIIISASTLKGESALSVILYTLVAFFLYFIPCVVFVFLFQAIINRFFASKRTAAKVIIVFMLTLVLVIVAILVEYGMSDELTVQSPHFGYDYVPILIFAIISAVVYFKD